MKRSRNKCIVLILLLAITVSILGSAAPFSQAVAQETTPAQRVREIISLRDTSSETYLLSDGTYERIIYAYDKYYRDGNNTLQLRDNTLVLDQNAAKAGNRQYKNASNAFEVTFSDSSIPTVTLSQDGQRITFSADSASGGNPFHISADQQAVRLGAVTDCTTLSTVAETGSNTITYANAFYNTDIVYVLENIGLKEYIILKNADAPNAVTFRFSMDGLTLDTADQVGKFLDKNGTEAFALAPLFAIDANGETTDALHYTFTPVKGTKDILVTVTLDNTYLAAANRAFPVVIDPTLEISSTKNPDASVYSDHPDTNYKYDNRLRTGKESSYGRCRSFIRFNLPTDITSAQVTDATLSLRKYSGVAPTTRAYRCMSSWSSGTITWNNMPASTVAHISAESVQRSSGSSWYEMNVTNMVDYWLDNPSQNYGCVIQDYRESDTSHWTSFYSCDGTSSRIPELHIVYTGSSVTPPPTEPTDPPEPEPEPEPDINDCFPNVGLALIYDQAYKNRFSEASRRVTDRANAIRNFYWDYCSLEVSFANPLEYTSYADTCTTNCDQACIHGGSYDGLFACKDSDYKDGVIISETYHHSNQYNNLYRMTPPTNPHTVKMLFIGHNTCREENGSCYPNSYPVPLYGLCNNALDISTVIYQENEEYESVMAIHEFGHFYGILDHDAAQPDSSRYSNNCLYGSGANSMVTIDDIVICQGCRSDLLAHINEYSY